MLQPWPVTPMARASPCARLHQRLERAVRAHRLVPVVRMAERVDLDEIHGVHPEALEGAVEILARGARPARAGLGGQEEVLPVPGHPGPDPQLGVAVARSGVDVVHPVGEQDLQRPIGLVLGGARQRGGAEDRGGALMPGASERPALDHAGISMSLSPLGGEGRGEGVHGRRAGPRPPARSSSNTRAAVTGGRSISMP